MDRTGMTRFRTATVEDVQAMLAGELAGDIDREDEFHMTASLYAANTGNNAVLKALLDAGASPNHCGGPPNQPILHFAVESKEADAETVALLLEAGADVDGVSKGLKATALQAVLFRTNKGPASRVALKLLEHGASCDGHEGDPCVSPPLGLAVRYNRDLEVIRALLDRGADPNMVGGPSQAPALHEALRQEREDDLVDEIVALLLAADAAPNATDRHGLTPLHLAARLGRSGPLNALLAAGADPEARDSWNGTALHEAAAFTSAENVRALLAAGSPLDACTDYEETALVCAAINNRVENAEVLIAAGADTGITDQAGRTALHYACEAPARGDGMIRLLAKAGLNPLDRDGQGMTAMELAIETGWPEETMAVLGRAMDREAQAAVSPGM